MIKLPSIQTFLDKTYSIAVAYEGRGQFGERTFPENIIKIRGIMPDSTEKLLAIIHKTLPFGHKINKIANIGIEDTTYPTKYLDNLTKENDTC